MGQVTSGQARMDRTTGKFPQTSSPKLPPCTELTAEASARSASKLALLSFAELLGVFTHDLSNPLQTAMMQLELLVESCNDPAMRERLTGVLKSHEELHALSQALSAYSHSLRRPAATCGVRASVIRLQKLLHDRLSLRKTRWEVEYDNLPPYPRPLYALEILLLRCLLFLAYEQRLAAGRDFCIRTNIRSRTPPSASSALALRVSIWVEGHSRSDPPTRIALRPQPLIDLIRTQEITQEICLLPERELQIDLLLAPASPDAAL